MCDVTACPYVGTHRATISALGGKLQREVSLCEEHWFLFNEGDRYSMGCKVSAFKQRLKEIDNGRFAKLIDAIDVTEECQQCFYLNPKVTDPGMGYRCRCVGSCIAVTLSNEVKSYLFWKLGEITEEQHVINVKKRDSAISLCDQAFGIAFDMPGNAKLLGILRELGKSLT